MKVILSLVVATLSLGMNSGFAQEEFEVPKYKLAAVEDYESFGVQAREAMTWLLGTDARKFPANRKDVNGFVLEWLNGSPDLHIEIQEGIFGDLLEDSGFIYGRDMRLIYMSGMALCSMEGRTDPNLVQLAGVEAMLASYQMIKDSSKSSHLKKLEKMKAKGQLEEWVGEQLDH